MTIISSTTPPIAPENLQLQQLFTGVLAGETQTSRANGGVFPHEVRDSQWSLVQPVRAADPKLVTYSAEMASLLGIDIQANPSLAAKIFTGSELVDGSVPYAMRYGGHQFGGWAGQLGDGRAIALGELTDTTNQHWTLQLKGAGPTPYSRQGDGFAVLRSSIREYLCSEAMHYLGIPTTRSLTLCLTGDHIERDIFYNGQIETERGAILCRAAHSFIRFGSFEIHAAHDEQTQLKSLADYVIRQDYPHLWPADNNPTIDTYQQWFAEVQQRTATLIAHWQRVGFVHAVMNTDNMSILGQTIDYGPYGWLEEYDPRWTPNFIDQQGRRYSYGNQPQIGLWNMYRLANAVLPLFNGNTEPLKEILSTYNEYFDAQWNAMSAAKIGIDEFNVKSGDDTLLKDLWALLETTSIDFTLFFRTLGTTDQNATPDTILQALSAAFYQPDTITDDIRTQYKTWLNQWQDRTKDIKNKNTLMNTTNPKYVLRNYVAQMAIDAAEKDDYSVIEELATVLKRPYDEQPSFEKYAALRPEWASQRPGCTMLTCSS